jgi:hypothetical protein
LRGCLRVRRRRSRKERERNNPSHSFGPT